MASNAWAREIDGLSTTTSQSAARPMRTSPLAGSGRVVTSRSLMMRTLSRSELSSPGGVDPVVDARFSRLTSVTSGSRSSPASPEY